MDINNHFIKVLPPASEHSSPRKIDDSPRFLRLQEGVQLTQLNIGNYVLKAERVSNQSIDGYVAIFNHRNQMLFEGEFVRSKKNGFGLQYNELGVLTFEGMFREDKYDGWGRSDCYTGEYREGVYDGFGVLSLDKSYYQGFFSRGEFNGEGIYFGGAQMINFHPIKNVNVFLTEGLKGNLQIMQKYRIDEIYIGEWKMGLKHGFGRWWKKDYWYAGQFSNGLPHGFGAEEDKKSKKVVQTKYKLGTKVD